MFERRMSKKIGLTLKPQLKPQQRRLAWPSLMALIIIALLTAASAAFIVASSSSRNGQTEEKKVELIKILSTGITPTQLTRAAGVCIFTIDNQSGIEEITLYLDRADGERVREIAIPKGVPNWGAEVDLSAGSYTLREANHPQWSCQITVQ